MADGKRVRGEDGVGRLDFLVPAVDEGIGNDSPARRRGCTRLLHQGRRDSIFPDKDMQLGPERRKVVVTVVEHLKGNKRRPGKQGGGHGEGKGGAGWGGLEGMSWTCRWSCSSIS